MDILATIFALFIMISMFLTYCLCVYALIKELTILESLEEITNNFKKWWKKNICDKAPDDFD